MPFHWLSISTSHTLLHPVRFVPNIVTVGILRTFFLHDSAALSKRSLLFWDVTQRSLVISYRCFRTTHRPHLQRLSSPRRTIFLGRNILLGLLDPRRRADNFPRNVGNYQSALRNTPEERRPYLLPVGRQ